MLGANKEGIAWAQGKLKVLVLYLFFRGVRYGYKGIKYSFLFYQGALGPPWGTIEVWIFKNSLWSYGCIKIMKKTFNHFLMIKTKIYRKDFFLFIALFSRNRSKMKIRFFKTPLNLNQFAAFCVVWHFDTKINIFCKSHFLNWCLDCEKKPI